MTLSFTIVVAAGCGMSDRTNHPPKLEPVSVTAREDAWKDFTLVATDEDGDVLGIEIGQTAFVEIEGVSQHRVDGGTRLEAEATLRPAGGFNGPHTFMVFLDDGIENVSVPIDATIEPVDDAPIAVSDRIAGTPNMPSVIAASTLLANDFDLDDTEDVRDELTISAVDSPFAGSVAQVADTITFTPSADFVGTGSFRYTISDGEKVARATVYIDVGGANAAPSPTEDMVRTLEGAPFEIPVSLLLGNDVDHDGHTLALIGVGNATHGAVTFANGTITFDPDDLWYGIAGFDYIVSDGVATAVGHVSVEVNGYI